jgi:2-polyprenyl-3-methyl-5-hydroxy-6-metoxy-1,4-benzoquinol methylase
VSQSQFHNVLTWGDQETELSQIQSKFIKYFPKSGRILDLGCGRGIFLKLLKENGFEPIGVEMDEAMYETTRKRGFVVTKAEATHYLEADRGKYDGIFASHIIEHMPIEQGKKFIELLKSHLTTNGVAIIVTPRPGSLWATENFWLDTTHVRPYPLELIKQLLAPLEIVASGIEPDSDPTIKYSQLAKAKLWLRRRLIGPELYDFTYGGGVSYVVAKKI